MFNSSTIALAALALGGIVRGSIGFVVPTGSLVQSSSSFGKRAPLVAESSQRNSVATRKAQGVRGLCATIPSVSQGYDWHMLRATCIKQER